MNIVAIRPAAIGDSFITLPILPALRKKYAGAHITFISNPAVLQLAREWGLADEVFDSGLLWRELISPQGVRNAEARRMLQEADLAICWMFDEDGRIQKNLLATGAREVIIGPEMRPLNPDKHMLEYLSEPLGMRNLGAGFVISWPGGSEDLVHYNPPIAIHPGCSDDLRRWPTASFADLAKQLIRRGYGVLLLGGADDDFLLKDIIKRVSHKVQPGMLTVLQNAPIVELARRIKSCRCFVGNDSGITHLAAILGVPSVVLFGPSDPVVMRPLGPAVEIIQKDPLKRLAVDKVLQRILQKG